MPPTTEGKATIPMWKAFWELFGTSNQLLASLSLLVIAVWLRKIGKNVWIVLVPALFMLGMTALSLFNMIFQYYGKLGEAGARSLHTVRFAITALLIALAVWITVEVVIFFCHRRRLVPESTSSGEFTEES